MPIVDDHKKPVERIQVSFDPKEVNRASDALLAAMDMARPTIVNETALIWSYIRISNGVSRFPAEMKGARANVLLTRLARVMADEVVAVARLSPDDPEFAAALAREPR